MLRPTAPPPRLLAALASVALLAPLAAGPSPVLAHDTLGLDRLHVSSLRPA